MKSTRVAVLALLPIAAFLTACGGGGHGAKNDNALPTTGTVRTGSPVKPYFDMAACYRRHGVTVTSGKGQHKPAPNKLAAATKACNTEAQHAAKTG